MHNHNGPKELTNQAIFTFWFPLALSWVIMNLAIPVLNAGVARLPNSEVQLAAIGVVRDITVLYESPIIMLLSASVALAKSRNNYLLLRRLTLHLILVLTLFSAIMNFTPMFDVLFTSILGLPQNVSDASQPAMRILLLWPALIAWRRLHQGVLIQNGRSKYITFGTIIRLFTLIIVITVGPFFGHIEGAFLGGIALLLSVLFEALAITLWARPLLSYQAHHNEPVIAPDYPAMTYSSLLKFCLPLSGTDVLRIISRPILVFGIARAVSPELSLAAWSVSNGLGMLLSSPSLAFPEVVVTLEKDKSSSLQLSRFILVVGFLLSSIFALIAFTSLGHVVFSNLMGISIAVEKPSITGSQFLVLLPLLITCRALLRGHLIRRRETTSIQLAMATNILSMILVMGLLIYLFRLPGILVGACSSLLAQGIEVLVLYARFKQLVTQNSGK